MEGYDKLLAKPNEILTISTAINVLFDWIKTGHTEMYGNKVQFNKSVKKEWEGNNFDKNRPITRAELAVLIDKYIQPFERKVDMKGNWK